MKSLCPRWVFCGEYATRFRAWLVYRHARNLVAYSPQKTHRGQSDFMPHDDLDGKH